MGPIEFAIIISLLGWLYVRYRASTLEMALRRRKKMGKDVGEIIKSDNYSNQLKKMAAALFHISLVRSLMPMAFAFAFFPSRPGNPLRKLTKSERKIYFKLITEHVLPVNALAAPHWYAFGTFLGFIVVFLFSAFLLGRIGTAKLKTRIESAVSEKSCSAF